MELEYDSFTIDFTKFDIIFYKYLITLKSNVHVYNTIKSIKFEAIKKEEIDYKEDKEKIFAYKPNILLSNIDDLRNTALILNNDVILEIYKKHPELLFDKSFLILTYINYPGKYFFYKLHKEYEYRALRDYPHDPKILQKLGIVKRDVIKEFQTTDLIEEEKKELKEFQTEINIYWVRHGYSCANYIKKKNEKSYNLFKRIAHTRVKDPKLHIVGREQAQKLAEIFNNKGINTDLICSSQLLRAIETAQTLYNRLDTVTIKKIMILPQICEEGFIETDDNIPYNFIDNKIPKETIQLDGLDYKKYYPSYEYFLRNVLVSLKDYLMSQEYSQEYNIIIVSHSHFLKTIFGKKLNNCQYILEKNSLYNRNEIIKLSNEIERKSKSLFGDASSYFKDAKKIFFEKNKKNYIFGEPEFETFNKTEEEGGCKDFEFKSKTKTKKSKSKTKSKY